MNFNNWLGTTADAINVESRAVDAWHRIIRDPAPVTIIRGSTALSEQTLRIVPAGTTERESSIGAVAVQMVNAFGIVGHPTLSDTDIQRDDRFSYAGRPYRVVSVSYYPGQVQAMCEAI